MGKGGKERHCCAPTQSAEQCRSQILAVVTTASCFQREMYVDADPCSSQPYTASSYGGFLGAPAIPITAYNSTMGYFCVSSVLTQLSAYFGGNITYNYIASIVSQQNTTALNLVKTINPNVICDSCFFGAFDTIIKYIPSFGNVSLASVAGYLGLGAASQIPANLTLTQGANAECAYKPLSISTSELYFSFLDHSTAE